MKFSLTTIAIAAQLGACAPSTSQQQENSFSLQQITNQKYHGVDGPTALINAYAKYGKPMPAAMRKAMQMNPELNQKFKNRMAVAGSVTGSVPAYPAPFYDSQYVVPVQLGSPPQTTYLNLDTGSADL